MEPPVKPKRRYVSRRRQEQAAETRAAILSAAQELFETDGYGPTTMAAVAQKAGVSPKTVYLGFESKSGLLRAVWNRLLRGERDDEPIAQKQWYREVIEHPDPEGQLRLNARNSRAAKLRIAGVLRVIREAASLHEDMESLWERIQTEYRANQRLIVETLADRNALKPGLDVEAAADMLWAINHPNLWELLVSGRGWTPAQYETWTADLACSQLLDP